MSPDQRRKRITELTLKLQGIRNGMPRASRSAKKILMARFKQMYLAIQKHKKALEKENAVAGD